MSAPDSPPVRAVLVCYRGGESGGFTAEFTSWESVEEARVVEAELTPCSPLCIGVHSVVKLGGEQEPRRRAGRHRPLTRGTCTARADGGCP